MLSKAGLMLKGVTRRVTAAPVRIAHARLASSLALKVPTEQGYVADIDGLTNKARNEAVFEKAYGKDLFNRDAVGFFEEGTRENPIPILSTESERVVGISLPDDSEIRWFTLRLGELCYDPDTCNFFALKQVTTAEVDEWVKRADQQVLGKH